MKSRFFQYLRYSLLGTWIVFTTSLAGWWYIFGVQQTHHILALEHHPSPLMAKHFKMLAWEGATFFVCLLAGGVAIAYFMIQEVRHKQRLQIFFSTFTHELKTPLASLRLQAESLKEDLQDSAHAKLVDRLVSDTDRLTIQLENSLFLANERSREMLSEKISLESVISTLRAHWPQLTIEQSGDCYVYADRRALDCVFTNLLQNASLHGKAKNIKISSAPAGKNSVKIEVRDDGRGFQGDVRQLGRLFNRAYSGSGNGIGLYLVRKLSRRMGGNVEFVPGEHFKVALTLPVDTV
jgi:signal transduction histidine kinase